MKIKYRKYRYSRSIANGVKIWLVMLILVGSMSPMLVSADVGWDDDFDDGDYDGWTVMWGNFSAANHYLECTGINETSGRSLIIHESNVTTGTWSLDCYLSDEYHEMFVVPHRDNETLWHSCLYLMSSYINLYIREGISWDQKGYWYSKFMFNETWTHIDLTVDEDMIFDVFVNGIHRIHYDNASHLTGDYGYFVFESEFEGQAIDNIVVSDTIDIEPNATTTTTPTTSSLSETTTSSTTSSPTETTATTTTTTSSIPTETTIADTTMILLIGGGVAVIVVIVLVIWKVRGRT